MPNARIFSLMLCFALILGLVACNDDDNPICPGNTAVSPTMENIWPHADGNAWVFDMAFQEFENPIDGLVRTDTTNYSDLPSMEELHAELQIPLPGTPTIEVSALYRLGLEGEITTETGVTAQRVTETMYYESAIRTEKTLETPDKLLRLIAQCRPDLRKAITPLLHDSPKDALTVRPPHSLGGYAFAFEDSGYYGYGDLDANHSWMYLDSNLDVGTAFSMQLVPAITDDIWLYGRIWSQGNLVVNGQEFENVVECMYLIDLGEQVMTDENGDPLGTFRSHIYTTIHFVPEIGPVMSIERQQLAPDSMIQEGDPITREYRFNLVGATQEGQ